MKLMSLRSVSKPRGSLAARLIPAGGAPILKSPAWPPMPRGLELGRKLATLRQELSLHARLAVVGAWRGAVRGSGVIGVGRLYAEHSRHYHACHDAWLKLMDRGFPGIRPACRCPTKHLGLVCTKLITDTGVAFFVDDWDNSGQDISTLNFHGCGTGVTAEAQTQTALVTESTTVLNPDSTRATGTRSQPSANVYRSVGTLTFDGAAAVTEHGIFSQAATGGGTMWDRSLFSAINVAALDSIQFTYDGTLSAGG